MPQKKSILIIGGGVTGMEASARLTELGFNVVLVERQGRLGGHVDNWDFLFPDRKPAANILNPLKDAINYKVEVKLSSEISSIKKLNGQYVTSLSTGDFIKTDAILVATGFDLFDAVKKEEYGYGIYEKVITAADLEEYFSGKNGHKLLRKDGRGKIGILHCVGSRDEKAGNEYCSKVCCVTGVKQAMKLREYFPGYEVYCFYMDLRMFGRYFEDLYKEAQEKWGVQFIRGRVSEASETHDNKIMVKFEDTLAGKPMKISLDLVILLTGFVPAAGALQLKELLSLETGKDRFFKPVDEHLKRNHTSRQGVFLAGACTGPKSIAESITEARAVALEISSFLKNNE